MRLWSLCPSLLDRKGLGGCWVEALLCQAVLAGKTKGYQHHPQVARWHASPAPLEAHGAFQAALHQEATSRGFNYNRGLILQPPPLLAAADAQQGTAAAAQALPPLVPNPPVLEVSTGQVEYELQHLLRKLQQRDPEHCARIQGLLAAAGGDVSALPVHPCFAVVPGPIAEWEVVHEEAVGGKGKKKGKGAKGKGAKQVKAAATTAAQALASDIAAAEVGATAAAAGTKRARATRSTSTRTIPIAGSEKKKSGAAATGDAQPRRGRSCSKSGGGGGGEEEEAPGPTAVGQKRKRGQAARGDSTATNTTTAAVMMLMVVQEEEKLPEPPCAAAVASTARSRLSEVDLAIRNK